MTSNHNLPIPVRKALKKLGKDIKEARLRRRISTILMADRIGTTRTTLKNIEDGKTSVAVWLYASALYVLGMLDRFRDIADIASDPVGQALSSGELPKRICNRKE